MYDGSRDPVDGWPVSSTCPILDRNQAAVPLASRRVTRP